jgi:hypothetical protein
MDDLAGKKAPTGRADANTLTNTIIDKRNDDSTNNNNVDLQCEMEVFVAIGVAVVVDCFIAHIMRSAVADIIICCRLVIK